MVFTPNPARRRLPAEQLQRNHGLDDKRGKVPLFSLAKLPVEVLPRVEVGRGPDLKAVRKKAKRLPQLLVLNNTNLVWDKRRPRKLSGAVLLRRRPL